MNGSIYTAPVGTPPPGPHHRAEHESWRYIGETTAAPPMPHRTYDWQGQLSSMESKPHPLEKTTKIYPTSAAANRRRRRNTRSA